MGPLQNEKMRMLGCKGARFGRNGQMAVNDNAYMPCGSDVDHVIKANSEPRHELPAITSRLSFRIL